MSRYETKFRDYSDLIDLPALKIGEAACLCTGTPPKNLEAALGADFDPLIVMVDLIERAIIAGLIDDLGYGWVRRDDVLKWLLETNIPIPEILQKELKKNPSAIGIFKESEADGYSKSNEITEEPKKSETNGPLGSKKTGSRPPQTELGKLAIETLLELRKEMEGEPTIVEVFLSLKKFDKGEIIQEIDRDIIQWSSQTGTDRTTIRKTIQNILSNFRRMEKRKLVEQN